MDVQLARANEAVVIALRRLRPQLRIVGTEVAFGVRRVRLFGGTPAQWSDLLASLDRVELVRADLEVNDLFGLNGHARRDADGPAHLWPPLPLHVNRKQPELEPAPTPPRRGGRPPRETFDE